MSRLYGLRLGTTKYHPYDEESPHKSLQFFPERAAKQQCLSRFPIMMF